MAAELLRWSVTPGEGHVVVALGGELDCMSEEELARVLAGVIGERHPKLTVDLAEVSFMDSSGLRCLVEAARKAASLGSQLVAVRAHGIVRRVLDVSGVGRELMGDSVDEETCGGRSRVQPLGF
jgi:anti-sigma B factor antagonist